MGQLTWRASDDLVDQVRNVAAAEKRSINDFLTHVLRSATDPAYAADGADRVRERLARAGLLAETGPPRERPDPELFAAARRAAGVGTSLSDLVSEDRG